jgi:hypothetical protein
MRAEYVKGKVDCQLRTVREHPSTPELRIDCEAPLGVAECRLERADLKDTDRHIGTAWHNREADVLSGRALAQRPRDESFEAFNA